MRQPETSFTLRDCKGPFMVLPTATGCPLNAQPQRQRQPCKLCLPLEYVLHPCPVMNGKARWWSPFSLDCCVQFKTAQPFPQGVLQMLLVSEQNQTAAVSLVVGFGFFSIFVSSLPPRWMLSLEERQCSDSERDDVLWKQQKWSCEAVSDMQPCLDKSS